MTRHLELEWRERIAIVRIDRPPANALDLELLDEADAFLEELRAADPAAVVITGREGFFSAGVDLKAAPRLDPAGQRAMVDQLNRLFETVYGFGRPVVCAVNGHAIAGGLVLALCGDYRVGPLSGKFGLTELRAGIPYPVAAMAIVKAELTPGVARRLVLGAELIEHQEAHALGLFDELAPPDSLLARSLEVARELAALPAEAYARIKAQLRDGTLSEIADALASGSDPVAHSWIGTESGRAAAAILRDPAGEP